MYVIIMVNTHHKCSWLLRDLHNIVSVQQQLFIKRALVLSTPENLFKAVVLECIFLNSSIIRTFDTQNMHKSA